MIERLSRIVSDVGSNANLYMVGRTNGLDTLINKNPSSKDAPVGPTVMAGTIEAIIGAVYIDGDMISVAKVMQNLGLMPRLVRKTGTKVPVSETVKQAVPTPVIEGQREKETPPKDSDETLGSGMQVSQELVNACRENSTEVQLKQRLDQNDQSP